METKMELREMITRIKSLAMIAKDKEQVRVPEDTVKALEEAVRFIEHERWIPVDEGVPENEDYILLSFSNFNVPIIGRYEDNNFYAAFETEPLIKSDQFVNAWKKFRRFDE